MRLSLAHPLLAALLLAVPAIAGWLLSRARPSTPRPLAGFRRWAAWTLMVLALSGASWQSRRGAQRWVIVDRSASVREGSPVLEEAVDRLRAARRPGDRVRGLAFAAKVAELPDEWLDTGFAWPAIEAEATEIAAAVRAATISASAGAEESSSRLLLLSDGRENARDAREGSAANEATDAVTAAREAAARGLALDVLPVCGAAPAWDGAVVGVSAPAEARRGELFEVDVSVRLATGASRLELAAAGAPIAVRELDGPRGLRHERFLVHAEREGLLPLVARLATLGDRQAANDRFTAATFVSAPATVLWLSDGPPPPWLRAPFEQSGFEVEARAPERSPDDPFGLSAYTAVVVEDLPAERLGARRLAALREHVELGGAGLLAIGASRAFAPGGWRQTPLAALLPVELESRGGGGERPLALLLLLDVSGSMGVVEDGVEKLEHARRAARGILAQLGPDDRLGLIAFAATAQRLRGLDPRPQPGEWDAALDRLVAGGGTALAPALRFALGELAAAAGTRRHLLLLSDGRSPPADASAIAALDIPRGEEGVTVSAIGLGADVDAELLTQLAERGGGRFTSVAEARALDELLAREAGAARAAKALATGGVPLRVAAEHAVTAGLRPPPAVEGLLRTTLRPGASAPWVGEGVGPLVALGAAGLGRAAALPTDLRSELGRALVTAGDFARFWGRLAAWLAKRGESASALQCRLVSAPRGDRLIVDAFGAEGAFVDNLRLHAWITGAAEERPRVELRQTAPGRYEATLPERSPGVRLIVVATDVGASLDAEPSRLIWSLDSERERREVGCDREALAALAAAGGGRVLEAVDDPFSPHESVGRERSLAPLLGPAAVLLLLFEWFRPPARVSRRSALKRRKQSSSAPEDVR